MADFIWCLQDGPSRIKSVPAFATRELAGQAGIILRSKLAVPLIETDFVREELWENPGWESWNWDS